ncbi:MAG: glycosyltransferase family 4 protein [Deltaproteobacteria bacterium]|nr:glycosyltransferase family 4 protein [Deltaproteobacteria bacterium]
MRVLHLATSFPFDAGSFAGSFIHHLVRNEVAQGISCTVLTPAALRPTEWPAEYPVRRFRYAPWSMQKIAQQPGGIPAALADNPFFYGLLLPFLASMATNIIRQSSQYDVIHAHWAVCGAMAVLTQPFHKLPVITTLRGSDFHFSQEKAPHRLLLAQAVNGSAVTTAVSENMADTLRGAFNRQEIRFVPNGVDDVFFRLPVAEPPSPDCPWKLLYVGSLIPMKGVDILLRALGRLSHHTWQLTVAGEGKEGDSLRALAKGLGVAERVSFLGGVAPKEIVNLMAEHHLFVLPSLWEGRPNVVLEAMAAGRGIVVAANAGCRELIEDGRNGWLFEPGKEEPLAVILNSVFAGERDIAAAGRAARRWVTDQGLTWEKAAARYAELYDYARREGHR